MTSDWSFTQGGPEEDPSNEFEVGLQFGNKEEVMLAVKQYSIRRAAEYKIVESDHWRYNVRCIQIGPDCNWSILISYRRKQEKWEVRRYTGPHTCMQTSMGQDHRRLDLNVIAQHIFTMVKADPTISIRVLQGGVENHFGFKVSYRKMYLSVTQPWPASTDTVMFHRVFWTFPPCVEAFKHCKPLISIDGTHLYGKYGGTLLMAIALNGNANILSIAFTFVEGVLVISDRHKSIDGALNVEGSLWKPPHAFQAFCTRHIAANFMTHFRNKESKKWAQHADEGRRFGHMTINISECINAVMKGSRNLPITALVKSRYFRLGELFARKGSEALAQL
ncbi:uncharacterized protein LOC107632919 [Arachis ipaensis]|uniref:uncharacterized protein LOC107632919 n=1 Tax=Arachis ipaensis TaxID=130454 RepID=UPI0007AF55A8|nr:uncharacterized protein LOC107632919 [Arachis ipaensis]